LNYALQEIKDIVIPIAKTYGVSKVGVFGSYARGDANENSDVDIYIEKGKLRSLIQYFSFVNDLEHSLGCHVDVVTTNAIDKEFVENIMREGITIYEE
jgi:predicted nucleotidyltransferase